MGMLYVGLDPRFNAEEQLGFIPDFLSDRDERPAREQINERYAHGGGWRPLPGWTFDAKTMILQYPGDPPLRPLAFTTLHGEVIIFYPHAQVLILTSDGKYEVARMD